MAVFRRGRQAVVAEDDGRVIAVFHDQRVFPLGAGQRDADFPLAHRLLAAGDAGVLDDVGQEDRQVVVPAPGSVRLDVHFAGGSDAVLFRELHVDGQRRVQDRAFAIRSDGLRQKFPVLGLDQRPRFFDLARVEQGRQEAIVMAQVVPGALDVFRPRLEHRGVGFQRLQLLRQELVRVPPALDLRRALPGVQCVFVEDQSP